MGRRRKRTFFEDSLIKNNATYNQYFARLMELALTRFNWKNLPDSVDPRFLELTLFEDGHALFFKDEELGYLALQSTIQGMLNVYRIPTRRRAYAVNGYQRELDESNSVIIYNNFLRTNSILDVRMFAGRLANLDRAIDVNANAQKTPVVILCPESQRLTMLNFFKEVDGNAPVIMGDKTLDLGSIKVLNTDAPYVADRLYTLKTQIWNEALTYLGISNVNIQKKERLITDEVDRLQGGVVVSRYSGLEARKNACEQINKMFGLNVDVEYREDSVEEYNLPKEEKVEEKEVVEDE